MKPFLYRGIALIVCAFLLGSCKTHQKASRATMMMTSPPILNYGIKTQAPTLVYKTRKDYSNKVPVLMNANKNRIISYPDPTDLKKGDALTLPIVLKNGYLLDQRGIGIHVAFLTYTYQDYSALSRVPSMNQLMESLLDIDPLTELWNCGPRTFEKNEVETLNTLIDLGFPKCIHLK